MFTFNRFQLTAHRLAASTLLAFAASVTLLADTDHVTIREDATCFQSATPALLSNLDQRNASISSPQDARAILDEITTHIPAAIHQDQRSLNCTSTPTTVTLSPDARDFYLIIHVFRWKDPSTDKNAASPDKQNWYVYHSGNLWRQEDFKQNYRLYGSKKNVWLVFIHLNGRGSNPYEVKYEIDLKDVLPAPLSDGLSLAQVFAGGAQAADTTILNRIGVYNIPVKHLPNDMSIQAESYAPPKEGGDPVATNLSDSPQKISNEGRYFWDFSVAVPVRKISQTTIDTTNNTITPKVTATTNAFGVIDLYPFPRDLTTPRFNPLPYVMAGAAMSHQPLQKLLFAAGWGPQFAQFYVGAILAKQPSQTGVTTVTNSYKPQLSFGINVTVKGFNQLRKSK